MSSSLIFAFSFLFIPFSISIPGISGKSQFLFALVFTTRYLDIFTNFVSPYNTAMKIIFLVTTYFTLYLIFIKFKATYDSNHDTFRAEFLVIPAAGLAVLVNHEFSVMEGRGSKWNSFVISQSGTMKWVFFKGYMFHEWDISDWGGSIFHR